MPQIIKILLGYIIIGILNTILFTSYLTTTSFPGGDVGMMPYGILISSLISLLASITTILILKTKIKISTYISIIIYHLYYLGILFNYGLNPLKENAYQIIDIFVIIISAIVLILALVSIKVYNKCKRE